MTDRIHCPKAPAIEDPNGSTQHCGHVVGRRVVKHGCFGPPDAKDTDVEYAFRCCWCGQLQTADFKPLSTADVTFNPGCVTGRQLAGPIA